MIDDPHPDVVDHVRWHGAGLSVLTSCSDCDAGGWCAPHDGRRWGIALPDRGAFSRRADGVEHFVDPNTGFFRRVGEVSQVAHPIDVVHSGTIIDVDPEVATPVLAELATAAGAFVISPAIDLAHQRLLATMAGGADDSLVEAQCLALLADAVAQRRPDFSASSRRSSATARRQLVNAVCEHLQHEPTITLTALGRLVHHSPFHLSRVFSQVMGVPLSRYRVQLRMHQVIGRLADHGRLDEIALGAGFSDHSHMTRTIVAAHGMTPSVLRAELRSLRA